jgi:2-dehydro-3-deoxyphosphogluconate aldolase/(4S)-4-hydroxy-2-oxoglutarate aldolase
MEKQASSIDCIHQQGILPLFYHDSSTVCGHVSMALYAAGVKGIEFTNRGAKALENFKSLVQLRDSSMKGLLLGIGTIKTADEAKAFIDAGADFLVSPVFDNGVCDVAYMNKLLWIPGCMTPTEIHVSQQAGCQLVKLFPGNVLGPGFVEAILPLFNKMSFVVTGGVDTTEESIRSWFKAGVAGVGLGSKLINKQVLEKGAYSELTQKTKEVLAIVSSVNKR